MRALKAQRASLEKQKTATLTKLQALRSGRSKADAELEKRKVKLTAAHDKLAAAKAKYEAIVARNRAAGIKPAHERPVPLEKDKQQATEQGPRGGRYYISNSGEKVYVKG